VIEANDMDTDIPNWLEAPEDLKKKSYLLMDKESTKLGRDKDSREPIDWNAVNAAVTDWWAKNGYSYP